MNYVTSKENFKTFVFRAEEIWVSFKMQSEGITETRKRGKVCLS